MKRNLQLLYAVLMLTLTLTFCTHVTYASQVPATETTSTEATESEPIVPETPVYQVTIQFKANGGKGSMADVIVKSGTTKKLPKNSFTKSGYKFAGWALSSNGSIAYANRADVSELATVYNNDTKITLYAQWKLPTPKLKKVTSKTPSYIDVTFGKVKNASGYTIQYSTNKKFKKNISTVTAGKNDTSARLMKVVPNKTYYIRMCSFKKKNGKEIWQSDWSKTLSVKVKNGKTLMNTKADYGIEADVKLKGSGSGYHAKLVIGSPTSAVSFGMQYDVGAANPYGSRNMALIENVASNAPGDQQYVRPGDVEFQLNKSYHLMITMDKKGKGDVYVDYRKIGSFSQPNLKNGNIFLWLEVSGRLNGDGVDAEFANIRSKDKFYGIRALGAETPFSSCRHDKTNAGLKCKYTKKTNTVRMYGTIKNLSGDWDSAYNGVSYRLHLK